MLLLPGFRPDRSRSGHDPYLGAKMSLFVVGAAIAIAGIVLERNWVINVGIGVLVIGFLLRLASRRRRPPAPDTQEE